MRITTQIKPVWVWRKKIPARSKFSTSYSSYSQMTIARDSSAYNSYEIPPLFPLHFFSPPPYPYRSLPPWTLSLHNNKPPPLAKVRLSPSVALIKPLTQAVPQPTQKLYLSPTLIPLVELTTVDTIWTLPPASTRTTTRSRCR